jgi:putative ABC transport system permease protein
MSFIVILLLCGVGFLIYWILSIRERELLFGVLRAMGLSGKGVIRMLLTEQLLGSILFIASGVGIGIGASVLYVPLIALAYMAQTQTLPLKLVIQPGDLVRLLVLIGLMLVVCMTVLIRLVFDMKITNALKLGED